jgi:hypothetical protein
LPCKKPSMANGRCRLHGGCSTGARTAEGLARCTAAPTKHGRRNAAARAQATKRGQARSALAELRRLLAMIQKGDDWPWHTHALDAVHGPGAEGGA